MHEMSLLISADKNIKRSKLHLARQDINKAEELSSLDTHFLVTEKQMLLQIAEQGQLSLFKNTSVSDHGDVSRILNEFTQRLTPFECLRSLGSLYLDINGSGKKNIWDKKMIRVVDQAISNRLKSVNKLTQPELNSLLLPLFLELPVISGNDMAGLFVSRAKGILSKIDDYYIISVFDNLINAHYYKPVLQEIKLRRKKADKKFAVMLDFYEVTLKHLNGDCVNNESSFLKVIENVSPSNIEPLRAAARKLSMHTAGNIVLKKALETFNFKFLTSPPSMDDDEYDDIIYGDDEYDDKYDDEMFAAMNKKLIANMEKLIIETGLKGASEKTILKFKKTLLRGPMPLGLSMIAEIADTMDKDTIGLMSREVRIIIFGKA
jgi:hypothetical protein